MMYPPNTTGPGRNSAPLNRRGATSQPLGGPVSQPLGGPASQPLGGPRPAGGTPSQRRLRLSEAVEHRMEASASRERQRGWLINTLLLAQALVTLALVPSYIIPTVNVPLLATLVAALIVYIAAFAINRRPGRLAPAFFTLTVGGGIVVTAQVFLTALLTHSGPHTAQATLFYLPVIIEAGLFLAPELTLVFAGVAAVLTAAGILLALALPGNAANDLGGAYQLVVNGLGLEALVGFMSWQLALFIYEQNTASQTVEDLRFAQARLEALQRQMADGRRQLQRDAGAIQTAISGMLAHEYDARVDIPDGELAPLAESLNLLFERLRSTNDLERRVQRMEADVPAMVDIAGRLADAGVPPQPGAIVTDTPLYQVGVALSQAQSAQARRLASLYQLSSDVVDALRDNHRALEGAATDSAEALRQAGELVALGDRLNTVAAREIELIAQARRLLARLLPRQLTDGTDNSTPDPLFRGPSAAPAGTGALDGLGIGLAHTGLTAELEALPPTDAQQAGIAPMTMPVQALEAPGSDTDHIPAVFASGDLPGELVDSWGLLRQLHTLAAQDQRDIASMAYDLGLLSRLVRNTDTNVAWTLQTLDTTQKRAEQAQALSGGSGSDLVDESVMRQNMAGATRRPAQPTRPLGDDMRLNESGRLLPTEPPSSATPTPGSLRVQDLVNPPSGPLSSMPFNGAAPSQRDESGTH